MLVLISISFFVLRECSTLLFLCSTLLLDSLIRSHFRRGLSIQRSLMPGTVWSETIWSSGLQFNRGCHAWSFYTAYLSSIVFPTCLFVKHGFSFCFSVKHGFFIGGGPDISEFFQSIKLILWLVLKNEDNEFHVNKINPSTIILTDNNETLSYIVFYNIWSVV